MIVVGMIMLRILVRISASFLHRIPKFAPSSSARPLPSLTNRTTFPTNLPPHGPGTLSPCPYPQNPPLPLPTSPFPHPPSQSLCAIPETFCHEKDLKQGRGRGSLLYSGIFPPQSKTPTPHSSRDFV